MAVDAIKKERKNNQPTKQNKQQTKNITVQLSH